ncbi:Cyclin-K [Halotydeus destructor]|nr:Cyclin-K [Halotydeus destructor]
MADDGVTPSKAASSSTKLSPGVWYLCPNNPCKYKADTLQALGQHLDEDCKFAIKDPNQTIVYQCPNTGCDFKSSLVQLNEHISKSCKYDPKRKLEDAKSKTVTPPKVEQPPPSSATNGVSQVVKPPAAAEPEKTENELPSNVTRPPVALPRAATKQICSICQTSFESSQELIEHMSVVHKMRASYKCSACAKPFPSQEAVENHIRDSHSKVGKMKDTEGQNKSPAKVNGHSAVAKTTARKSQTRSSVDSKQEEVANKNIDSAKNGQVKSEHANSANGLVEDSNADQEPEQLVTEPDLPPPMDPSERYPDEEMDETPNELHCMTCGLEFPDKEVLERHESTCPEDTQLDAFDGGQSFENMDVSASAAPTYLKHFKHEHINLVSDHSNVHCKNCMKKFSHVHGLCNHLSRRLECREWYCQNLHTELDIAEERRTRLGLPKPPPLPRRGAWKLENPDMGLVPSPSASASATTPSKSKLLQPILPKPQNTPNSTHSEPVRQVSPAGSGTPKRASAINSANFAKTAMKEQLIDGFDISPAGSPRSKNSRCLPLSKKLLRCGKCKKIFGGKSPWVAFRNHLRGAKACATFSMKAEIIVQENVVNAFQQQYTGGSPSPSPAKGQPSPRYRTLAPVKHEDGAPRKNQELGPIPPPENIRGGMKYFCKLCPKRDIKNRVSLGCHLTIYHGLPQVNCDNNRGEAFRCQNCLKIFTTKHYYNCHRKECDMNSPYVGVIDEEGTEVSNSQNTLSPERKAELDKHVSQPTMNKNEQPSAAELRVLNSQDHTFFSNRYKCHLCSKQGFYGPNAVKIHQKYQCINRHMLATPAMKGVAPSRIKTTQRSQPYVIPLARGTEEAQVDEDVDQGEGLLAEPPKSDPNMRKCEDCGKGPYKSYYYYMEHKKNFCQGPTDVNHFFTPIESREDKPQNIKTYSLANRSRLSSASITGGGDELKPQMQLPRRAGKTTTQSRPLTPQQPISPPASCSGYSQTQRARKSMSAVASSENGFVATYSHDYEEQMELDDVKDEFAESPEIPEYVDQIVKCLECKEEFEQLDTFVRHRMKHIAKHIADKGKSVTDVGEVDCEICNLKVVDPLRMQSHLLLHLQNYLAHKNRRLAELKRRARPPGASADDVECGRELSCAYCKTTYFSRVELAKHMRLSCPMKHKCSHCSRTYLNSDALREHKEQCVRESKLRGGLSKRSIFECKNCYLEFKDKQDLQWHMQACSKIHNADLAGKVEEIVQRSLTCAVCGMVSQEYENKVVHEKRCLQRYLAGAGLRESLINDSLSDIEPYQKSVADLSSLMSEGIVEVDKDDLPVEQQQPGQSQKVGSRRTSAARASQLQPHVAPATDKEALAQLRLAFSSLVDLLFTDEDLKEDFINGEKPENLLEKMLRHLGEEPAQFLSGTSELNHFRINLQTFLSKALKPEILEKANQKSTSIDETLYNLLNYPDDLNPAVVQPEENMSSWLYDKGQLKRSPSAIEGVSWETECRYRRECARFIMKIGTTMKLRYDTMATGVVYMHRFYMCHSFKTFPRFVTASCCLFLAGKVEETPKKCKDIIKLAKDNLTEQQFATFGEDPKEMVLTMERILLQTMNFDLQLDHPYKYLLSYAKSMKGDQEKLQKMVQMAWTFINDSLCTCICLQWEPEIVAIALMYLAGKLSNFQVTDWQNRLPTHKYWWELFVENITIGLLDAICHHVLDLYEIPVSDTPQDSPPPVRRLSEAPPISKPSPNSGSLIPIVSLGQGSHFSTSHPTNF